jgi:hypothetical protein
MCIQYPSKGQRSVHIARTVSITVESVKGASIAKTHTPRSQTTQNSGTTIDPRRVGAQNCGPFRARKLNTKCSIRYYEVFCRSNGKFGFDGDSDTPKTIQVLTIG